MKIQIIKTWYGNRYAVVEPYTSHAVGADKKITTTTADYPIEYKVGKELKLAIFPLTKEGLEKAKEVKNLFKK